MRIQSSATRFRPVRRGLTAVCFALVVLLGDEELAIGTTIQDPDGSPQEFVARIAVDRAVYQLGDTPQIAGFIDNNSDEEVLLVPALDGSVGMRCPLVGIEIVRPPNAPELGPVGRCGNTNLITPEDFKNVSPGESLAILNNWVWLHPDTFSVPGKYTATLHYSTDCDNERWYGFMGILQEQEEIDRLLDKVPSIRLRSEPVSFVIRADQ